MSKLSIFSAVALATVLAGCQSPSADMANSQFTAIQPQPLPAAVPGVWTGSMGPYTATMQWQADGVGLFCYSWGEADSIQRVKFSGGRAYIEDGTRLDLVNATERAITVYSPYGVGKESTLYADGGYRNASLFCADALQHYAGADTPPYLIFAIVK